MRFLLMIYFVSASLLAHGDVKRHKPTQQPGFFTRKIRNSKISLVPNVGSPSYERISNPEKGESFDAEAQASGLERDSKSRLQNVQSASGSCELSQHHYRLFL
jgi:hypothetical protein